MPPLLDICDASPTWKAWPLPVEKAGVEDVVPINNLPELSIRAFSPPAIKKVCCEAFNLSSLQATFGSKDIIWLIFPVCSILKALSPLLVLFNAPETNKPPLMSTFSSGDVSAIPSFPSCVMRNLSGGASVPLEFVVSLVWKVK